MSGEYIQYETMEGQVQRLGRVGGFAPGSYMSKCLTCGAAFEGDKRAISCLPCAVGKLQDTRPTPTVEGGDDDALTVSYMLGRKEAADALASRDAEIERLRKELGHVEASIQTAHLRRLKAERDAAEAERHRYAFALGVSEKALEYAADIRFLELAEGSQLTVIDRQRLGELHNGSMSALSTIKTAMEEN